LKKYLALIKLRLAVPSARDLIRIEHEEAARYSNTNHQVLQLDRALDSNCTAFDQYKKTFISNLRIRPNCHLTNCSL